MGPGRMGLDCVVGVLKSVGGRWNYELRRLEAWWTACG